MTIQYQDPSFEEQLKEARDQDRRKSYWLTGFVGLVALAPIVGEGGDALSGQVPALGRAAVGVLGLTAAGLLYLRPASGWWLAMAWALVQVPFYAWSPDGSLTSQVLEIPIRQTYSVTTNGQLTYYSSYGVNLFGLIVVIWLRAWRYLYER